jgi:hypothetical protein
MEAHNHDQVTDYKPLIIVVIFCLLLSLIQLKATGTFMYPFMGYFFIFLSLFKFFDLNGFVDGFSTYDLVTQKFRPYGYVYPFIEFGLGCAYLAQFEIVLTNWVTLIVMIVSGIGVIKSVMAGRDIKCACLGTAFNLPLSTVSIVENLGMGLMAAFKLLFH